MAYGVHDHNTPCRKPLVTIWFRFSPSFSSIPTLHFFPSPCLYPSFPHPPRPPSTFLTMSGSSYLPRYLYIRFPLYVPHIASSPCKGRLTFTHTIQSPSPHVFPTLHHSLICFPPPHKFTDNRSRVRQSSLR